MTVRENAHLSSNPWRRIQLLPSPCCWTMLCRTGGPICCGWTVDAERGPVQVRPALACRGWMLARWSWVSPPCIISAV